MEFMDYNLSVELQEYLYNNERLIWTGKPKKGILFRRSDVFFIPFSLLWCGFAIFWVLMVAQESILFAMFGIPFVFVGLILVFGRFFIDAAQRAKTIYGLTNDRIIIKYGVFKKTIKSVSISSISDIECNEKGDGTGTIIIGSKNPTNKLENGMGWWPGVHATPALEAIQDVRYVYNRILESQKTR